MSNFYTDVPLEDISQGSVDVDSGVNETEVYFLPAAHATGVPGLPVVDPSLGLAELATLTGEFTLVADKFWKRIPLLVDQSEVKQESVGSKGQSRYKSTFEFLIGGTDAQKLGFGRVILNTPGYYAVKQRSGQVVIVGSANSPAWTMSGSVTFGKGAEDVVGGTYTVESNSIAALFTGVIATE